MSDAEIAVLSRWIEAGAVWPDSGIAPKPGAQFAVTDKHRNWWAFHPVKRPGVPKVAPQPTNSIDAFVRAKLDAAGLKPATPADKRTLLRRVTFDLIGLPATPDEVDAFLKDVSTEAFAKVVDRLLDSPAYGQRWARHWLDVARYADYHDGKPLGPATHDLSVPNRSLYVQTARWDRSNFATLFEAANPDAAVERRDVSTVAPQALFLLNHEFVLAQAKHLADRATRDEPTDEDARIRRLFRLTFTRSATDDEVKIARQLLSAPARAARTSRGVTSPTYSC